MRIKAILSVSAVVLALFAGAVQAEVITRDVTIDLETDGRIIAFSDSDAWEGIVSIEDTTFATGDTVLLNIRFANSKSLKLSNPGNNPLNSGIELTKLTFYFETPNGAYDSRASGYFTYVGVYGDLLSNPTYWDINGGIGPFSRENLTDTSFSYSGINIEINFDPSSINEDHFECLTPPCVFNQIEWSSSAEDVRIVDAGPFNLVPVADCGQERVVVFGEVTLDGSASYDRDGTIATYEWSLQHEDGSTITASGLNPTITNIPSGFYDVSLTVTDDGGLVDVDNMLLAAAGSCFCDASTMHIQSTCLSG